VVNDGEDPIADPSLRTVLWRDLGKPECELQGGIQFGSFFPNDGYRDYTVTAAGAADPWMAGTGLAPGDTISGLVGFEFDSFFPGCQPPGTPTILFSYQGPETGAQFDAAAVTYTAASSGARVFSSGSLQFAWGLDSYRWDPDLFTGIPPTNPGIQQFTRNMFADMAAVPPAGPAAFHRLPGVKKKCRKGFKRVRGKCRKKKRRCCRKKGRKQVAGFTR
jgi:hypothetical protein